MNAVYFKGTKNEMRHSKITTAGEKTQEDTPINVKGCLFKSKSCVQMLHLQGQSSETNQK